MKLVLRKQKLQIGLLVLAICCLLVSTSPAQNTDTSIVFMSQRSGTSEICRMSPDGKQIRQLTEDPQYANQPAWSPDGTQIAFTSLRDGNGEIYVMNAEGTNPINLTQHREWDTNPSWGSVPTLSVSPNKKLAILWGEVKRAR